MFSKNYFPSVSHTQNNAVVAIKGSEVNDSGTINEAINAIDYYISSIDGASIDKIGYYHEVYSEKCATGVQRKRRLTPSNEFRRKAKRPENPCK